jgi:hypothetical protein
MKTIVVWLCLAAACLAGGVVTGYAQAVAGGAADQSGAEKPPIDALIRALEDPEVRGRLLEALRSNVMEPSGAQT